MSRLLAPPIPVDVEVDAGGSPARINRPLSGALEVVARWRVELDWWLQPVRRDYWRVVYEGRLLCEVFHDHDRHTWFLERVFD